MGARIEIPDDLYESVRRFAVQENTTVTDVVLHALETTLHARSPQAPLSRLQLPMIHSDDPGSLAIDNERVYDLIGCP